MFDASRPSGVTSPLGAATKTPLSTSTNDAGLYRVPGLSPGSYRIEVEASGFQRLSRDGVLVQISQTVQVDAQGR